MIAIENFTATTMIEGADGQPEAVACTVVGINKNSDGTMEFTVVIEQDGDIWISTREVLKKAD